MARYVLNFVIAMGMLVGFRFLEKVEGSESANWVNNRASKIDIVARRHAAADLCIQLMKRNGIWYEDPLNWKIISERNLRLEVELVASSQELDLDLANMCAHCMGRLISGVCRTPPVERADDLETSAIQLANTTDDPAVKVILLVGLASSKSTMSRDAVVAATDDPQLGARKSACYLIERCTAKSFGPCGVIHAGSPASDVDAAGRRIRALYESDKTLGAILGAQWGAPVKGLQCRVTGPTVVEQGMPLKVTVELRSIADNLEPGVGQLNTFLYNEFLKLYLKNVKTQKTFTVRPYTYSYLGGPPAIDTGVNVKLLDGSPLHPWQVSFPLVGVREALELGVYKCTVEYSFPKEQTRWWNKRENWKSFGFWHGTVVSGPFQLKILKETPKTRQFLLPKQLCYSAMDRRVYYVKQDAVKIEVPVSNGFFIGTCVRRTGAEGYSLRSAAPVPDDINGIDNCVDIPEDGNLTYTVEVFETPNPPCHLWDPGFFTADYKVLWKKTFDVRLDGKTPTIKSSSAAKKDK